MVAQFTDLPRQIDLVYLTLILYPSHMSKLQGSLSRQARIRLQDGDLIRGLKCVYWLRPRTCGLRGLLLIAILCILSHELVAQERPVRHIDWGLPHERIVLMVCTYGNHGRFDRLVWSNGRVLLWDNGKYYLTHVDSEQIRKTLDSVKMTFNLKDGATVWGGDKGVEPYAYKEFSIWSDYTLHLIVQERQPPKIYLRGNMPRIPARSTVNNKEMWCEEFYSKLPSIKKSILEIGTEGNIYPRIPVSVESQIVNDGVDVDWSKFREHPQYIVKKKANEISYYWDNIIQMASSFYLNGIGVAEKHFCSENTAGTSFDRGRVGKLAAPVS